MIKIKCFFPTVLHKIDGPAITSEQIVNIAPGEGKIPVTPYNEPPSLLAAKLAVKRIAYLSLQAPLTAH